MTSSLKLNDLNPSISSSSSSRHINEYAEDLSLLSHIASEEENLYEYAKIASLPQTKAYYQYTGSKNNQEKEELESYDDVKSLVDKYNNLSTSPLYSPVSSPSPSLSSSSVFSQNQQSAGTSNRKKKKNMSQDKRFVEYQKLSILSKSQMKKHNAYTEAEVILNKAIERAHLALFQLADVADDSLDNANSLLHTRMYQPAKERKTCKNIHISPTPSPVKKKKTVQRYRNIIKRLAN